MKVLLTGGTGFIGSYLAMALVRYGDKVRIVARNPQKIPALNEMKGLEVVEGDINEHSQFPVYLDGCTGCIHNALVYSDNDKEGSFFKDLSATAALALTAADMGIKSFIYTSSTSVNDMLYTDRGLDDVPVRKITRSTRHTPATMYGALKAAGENYLQALSHQKKMRINIIRPGYTFGNPVVPGAPVQPDNRFSILLEQIIQGKPEALSDNDGTQFIWAGHLARLYVDLLHSKLNKKVYFALSQDFISWKDVADEIHMLTGIQPSKRMENLKKTNPLLWDTGDMISDFSLSFSREKTMEKIREHISYLIENR